jgi:glycine/D-amino acid oxidase-like deaminating enzyme
VIRNNYFQPAMRELMAHSVNIWESDPETYSYHPVGYMQISCESMREDVAAIHAQQQGDWLRVCFRSKGACREWPLHEGSVLRTGAHRASPPVLHEMPGGYANNSRAMIGLAAKAEALGVRIISGITCQSARE